MSMGSRNEFEDWPIDDLRLVLDAQIVNEDGSKIFAVYSYKLDAITFIGDNEASLLKSRGIQSILSMPDE